MQPVAVPDLLTVDVTPGTRVLITSDLHLAPTPTEASRWATVELAATLRAWDGPGVLVLAGDLIELWAVALPDVRGALDAHPDFTDAINEFAAVAGRRVVCLPGNHDGRLGWDDAADREIAERLDAELTFAVELTLPTPSGPRPVRVEHGHRFDPANDFTDPRNPDDTPLGQHIVQEILPSLKGLETGFLDGVESLADPRTFPAFISSRIFYRRVLRHAWWLLLPIVFALALRIPLSWGLIDRGRQDLTPFAGQLVILDFALIADILLVATVLLITAKRAWKGASVVILEKRGAGQNDNARAAAAELVDRGYAGMVSGHTHHAELSRVGTGFYANSGSGTKVVEPVPSHFGLPDVYAPALQLSWVELVCRESGWEARLVEGRRDEPEMTALEQRVARKRRPLPPDPTVTVTLA